MLKIFDITKKSLLPQRKICLFLIITNFSYLCASDKDRGLIIEIIQTKHREYLTYLSQKIKIDPDKRKNYIEIIGQTTGIIDKELLIMPSVNSLRESNIFTIKLLSSTYDLNLSQVNSALKKFDVNEYKEDTITEDTTNRKCLSHIIEQCNKDEKKLKGIYNTFLPQAKQTLLNHLIQTNSSDELIHDNIMYLVEHKADLNLKNKNGNTLIHLYLNDRKYYGKALNYANGAKQQYLLVSKKGEFHRHETTFFDHIGFFIKNNGNFSNKNNNGQTPLHMRHALCNVPKNDIYLTLKKNNQLNALLIEDKKKRIPLIELAADLSFDTIGSLISDKKIDHVNVKDARSDDNVLHLFVRDRRVIDKSNSYGTTEEEEEEEEEGRGDEQQEQEEEQEEIVDKTLTYEQIKILMRINKKLLCQKNKKGKSALDIICYNLTGQQRLDLKKHLTIDINLENITDENDNTFIHKMCYDARDNDSLIKAFNELRSNKGLLDARNKFGETPLHLALSIYDFRPISIAGTGNFFDNPCKEMNALMTEAKKESNTNVLDIKDQNNRTVFYTACHKLALPSIMYSSKIYWVNHFLTFNPNLDQKNTKGNAPIHKIMQIVYLIGPHTIDNDTIKFDDEKLPTIKINNLDTLLKIKNENNQDPHEYADSAVKKYDNVRFLKNLAQDEHYLGYHNVFHHRKLKELYEYSKYLMGHVVEDKEVFYQKFRAKFVEAFSYLIKKVNLYEKIVTKYIPSHEEASPEYIRSASIDRIGDLLEMKQKKLLKELKKMTFEDASKAFYSFEELKRLKKETKRMLIKPFPILHN